MSDFYLSQGDTASPIFETLLDDDGNAVDIAGATIHLDVTPIRGGTKIVNSTANNLQAGDGSNGSKGQVSYGEAAHPWTTETATSGDFLYRWTVTYSGGQVQGFPNDGFRLLTITPDASTTAAVYLSREEFKKTLNMTGESYADADIDAAIAAASRGLEAAYDTIWTKGVSPTEVRYYRAYGRTITLGDVLHVNSISLDYGLIWNGPDYYWDDYGPGDYGTALASTDYLLLPIQNGLVSDGGNGEPFQQLELVRGSSLYTLPHGDFGVKITGQFGWESVPAGVRVATSIIASRLLKRTRDYAFGIISAGIDGAALRSVDLARDAEVSFVMRGIRKPRILIR